MKNVVAFGFIFILIFVFGVVMAEIDLNDYLEQLVGFRIEEIQDKVKECEKDLPRSQKCVVELVIRPE